MGLFIFLIIYMLQRGNRIDASCMSRNKLLRIEPPNDDQEYAPDSGADDQHIEFFGWSVAAYENTVVIGNVEHDMNRGAVYVYDLNSNVKQELSVRYVDEGMHNDENFGYTIDICGDTLVIGCFTEYVQPVVYVYTRKINGDWVQTDRIFNENSGFGMSVSCFEDTIVIGSYKDTIGGSAYVYKKSKGGKFKQIDKLTASDGKKDNWFGWNVAIHSNIIVVSAWKDQSAYYYIRDINGKWNEIDKITAADGEAGDNFGYNLAVFNRTVVIGAYGDNNLRGSVYVHEIGVNDYWEQTNKFEFDNVKYFGKSVAMYDNTIVIGAPGDSDNGGVDSGSIYIYYRDNEGRWILLEKQFQEGGKDGELLGHSVAVTNETMVIGAQGSIYTSDLCYISSAPSTGPSLLPSVSPTFSPFRSSVPPSTVSPEHLPIHTDTPPAVNITISSPSDTASSSSYTHSVMALILSLFFIFICMCYPVRKGYLNRKKGFFSLGNNPLRENIQLIQQDYHKSSLSFAAEEDQDKLLYNRPFV